MLGIIYLGFYWNSIVVKKRPENVRKVLSKHNPFSIVDGN